MRQLFVVPVLLFLIGCRTSAPTRAETDGPAKEAVIDEVFASYAVYFPEAKRVPTPANPHDYLAGIYSTGRPGSLALSGRILYLFPDATFIAIDWTDITGEQIIASGAWRYERGCLEMIFFWPTAPAMDATYVPLRFSDSTRDQLTLLGTPNGVRGFNSWVATHAPEMRSARIQYNADVRERKDFDFTERGTGEYVYIAFFHSTYSRDTAFQELNWKPIKQRLLSRRLSDGSKVPIGDPDG